MDIDWQADLDQWLAPFVAALRHRTRARMCPAYIAGLIDPGDRKSVQPMAARAGEVSYDQLDHFVAAGVWDSALLEAALLKEADGLVGDAAGSRPERNKDASATVATMALTTSGPRPGILARRWLTGLARCHARICASTSASRFSRVSGVLTVPSSRWAERAV